MYTKVKLAVVIRCAANAMHTALGCSPKRAERNLVGFLYFSFKVFGIELRALQMLVKYSSTEPHPSNNFEF